MRDPVHWTTNKAWRPPTSEDIAAFEAKVRRGPSEDDCYEWLGKHRAGDYGSFAYCGTTIASRAAWMIYMGQIPDGLYVCHHCDNPPCTNIRHLFLGTPQDNLRDAGAKGRLGHQRPLLTIAGLTDQPDIPDEVWEEARRYAYGD